MAIRSTSQHSVQAFCFTDISLARRGYNHHLTEQIITTASQVPIFCKALCLIQKHEGPEHGRALFATRLRARHDTKPIYSHCSLQIMFPNVRYWET